MTPPRKKQKRISAAKKAAPLVGSTTQSLRPKLTESSLNDLGLEQKLRRKFKWDAVQPFQLRSTIAQLLGVDALVHVGTGKGKTAIAAGPHVLDETASLVTLFIAPLLSLHFEMVKTFESKYGLKAIAVNSRVTADTKEIFWDIIKGQYNIVIVSPEMLVSSKFIDGVLRVPEFRSRILSAVVDEAHCISHWGSGFRKAYSDLTILRYFMLPGTPIVAMSGTLTPKVRRDVCSVLRLSSERITIDEGNDRPNISYIVTRCKHPLNSYRDLNIILPSFPVNSAESIPKTFVYVDSKPECYDIVDYLRSRLPAALAGTVRPFNASHTNEYKELAMNRFSTGLIRILVCTEAAGMGCDIPDVELVAQWKVPSHLSAYVQRSGRVACHPTLTGISILFAEPNAYNIDPSAPATTPPDKALLPASNGPARYKSKPKLNKKGKDYDLGTPVITDDTPGEGIYWFVQTKKCRRQIINEVFRNPPSYPKAGGRQPSAPKGVVCPLVISALQDWREKAHARDYPTATWDSTALLDDSAILRIAAIGPIESPVDIDLGLQRQWHHLPRYRTELFELLSKLNIPAFQAAQRPQSRLGTTGAGIKHNVIYAPTLPCQEPNRNTIPTGTHHVKREVIVPSSPALSQPSIRRAVQSSRPRSCTPIVPTQAPATRGVSWQQAELSMPLQLGQRDVPNAIRMLTTNPLSPSVLPHQSTSHWSQHNPQFMPYQLEPRRFQPEVKREPEPITLYSPPVVPSQNICPPPLTANSTRIPHLQVPVNRGESEIQGVNNTYMARLSSLHQGQAHYPWAMATPPRPQLTPYVRKPVARGMPVERASYYQNNDPYMIASSAFENRASGSQSAVMLPKIALPELREADVQMAYQQ